MNERLQDGRDAAVAALRRVAADERTHAAAARQSARIESLGAPVAHGGTVSWWAA